MADLTGRQIDRYHIEAQLGEGGMATVYRAFDTRLERQVALKVIRQAVFNQEQMAQVLRRFEREAKSLAQLSHPNIVKVYDYGVFEGAPYFVMEYLPNGTLKNRAHKVMPWREAVTILLPIAKALTYAHSVKVIHRDIKPANILLTASGEPTLSDFGIAKILESGGGQTLTGTGVGIGTPEYMAPEQGMGREVDGRADVYALGIVLYELITGRKPYEADTPMAVVLKHITDPLPNPALFIKDLPAELVHLLEKALAKEAVNRYPDMAAFSSALERLLQLPVSASAQTQAGKSDEATWNAVEAVQGAPVVPVATPKPFEGGKSPAAAPRRMSMLALGAGAGLLLLCLLGVFVLVGVVLPRLQERDQGGQALDFATQPPAALELTPSPVDEPEATAAPLATAAELATAAPLATDAPTAVEPTKAPEEAQPTETQALDPDSMRVAESDGMVQVFVPEGEFRMGSSEAELAALRSLCPTCEEEELADQSPQRTVFLDAFWMDQSEVTNAQFGKFVTQTGYQTTAERNGFSYVLNLDRAAFDQVSGASWRDLRSQADVPVVHVSWDDAVAYCEWAGRRLPTEAEWEKAARGPDGWLFPWGDELPTRQLANYYELGAKLEPVGRFPQGNSYYQAWDMAGNAIEWVADFYAANYYSNMPLENPAGPPYGDGRVYRGGGWSSRLAYELYSLAASGRRWNYPNLSRDNLGFRCAQSDQP